MSKISQQQLKSETLGAEVIGENLGGLGVSPNKQQSIELSLNLVMGLRISHLTNQQIYTRLSHKHIR